MARTCIESYINNGKEEWKWRRKWRGKFTRILRVFVSFDIRSITEHFDIFIGFKSYTALEWPYL